MKLKYFLLILLLLPLIFPLLSSGVVSPPPRYYIYFNVTVPEGYKLLIVSTSNTTFPLIVFTTAEYQEWIDGQRSQAVLVTNISYGNYSLYLQEGKYIIVIDGYGNVTPQKQNYSLYLVPYNALALLSQPKNDTAIGIAVYGINNRSFYIISTNAILGYFNISSINAYNSSFLPHHGASLQLNTVLRTSVNQSLFLQDVITFITNERLLSFVVNIWNLTTFGASLNGSTFYYYSISHSFYYSLPLAGYLIINVTNTSNGVEISFGYSIIQNGSFISPKTCFFNTVYFPFKGYILIDPYNLTGNYHAYDTELVFGGYGNGEIIISSHLIQHYYFIITQVKAGYLSHQSTHLVLIQAKVQRIFM